MTRADLTEKILDIKREKGWTWKHICGEIGGFSPMLIVGALLGQMKLTKPQAAKAAELFGLSKTEEAMLNEVPLRGTPMPPTDPLLYRFYELVMVNGPAWKALIEEEFGDGIMSAIDFDLEMERLPNPKGDRVKITMSGKFLPYKYYGATGNIPEYGYTDIRRGERVARMKPRPAGLNPGEACTASLFPFPHSRSEWRGGARVGALSLRWAASAETFWSNLDPVPLLSLESAHERNHQHS